MRGQSRLAFKAEDRLTALSNRRYSRDSRKEWFEFPVASPIPREEAMPDTIAASHAITIEDVEYQPGMLARLYRPKGTGPFPAALQVHGGAWTSKDRTDNDFMAKALAESGIFVASIDFRMPPVAPHPGSIQDINLGTRWLKANARSFGSRPEWVGSFGTSSGGHQVLLAAMRPNDPRYTTLPGPAGVDATLAWVISGWGVLDPLLRYNLAKQAGKKDLVHHHDTFWLTEEAQRRQRRVGSGRADAQLCRRLQQGRRESRVADLRGRRPRLHDGQARCQVHCACARPNEGIHSQAHDPVARHSSRACQPAWR
jgi:acetyl esterase/lipase